ncbi:MAG: lamin tail domain-containing protein, partial [Anaerolineae bacterium]|nr:lamin tail domain-containing protein [Anaerolineae bacterium]
LDPDLDFANGETCTVTILAAQVSDQDTDDPPDTMSADDTFSFTTIAAASGWVINEIHADPAPDLTGDANGDGIRDESDDEFIEIVNNTGSVVDISGWTLADGVGVKHTFPAGTIVSGQCPVVVFAGGTPAGAFGGATVQTASTGQLGLNNAGDTITLNDGLADQAVYTFGSEGGNDQSLTRDPDLIGIEPLVLHSTAAGSGGSLFSPGVRVDGSIFAVCGPPDTPPAILTTTPPNGATGVATDTPITIVFDEIVGVTTTAFALECPAGSPIAFNMVPPVPGNVDSFTLTLNSNLPNNTTCAVTILAAEVTDQDGPPDKMNTDYVFTFDTAAVPSPPAPVLIGEFLYDGLTPSTEGDEFVEVCNPNPDPVDLTGYKVGDEEVNGGGESMYQFPAGALLATNACRVVAKNAIQFEARFGTLPDFEVVVTGGSYADHPTVPNLAKYTAWGSGNWALSNTGDELLVLGPNDEILDKVAYRNGDYTGLQPAWEASASEPHSLQRIWPTDTDSMPYDFVRAQPNPGAPTLPPAPIFLPPAVLPDGMYAYWGDLHAHTSYSDGAGPPHYALAMARAAGLHFFAITDHGWWLSPDEWVNTLAQTTNATAPGQFVALRGVEWTHQTAGHINVFNSDTLLSRTDPAFDTLPELYGWLAANPDAIAQFNHPGANYDGYFDNFPFNPAAAPRLFMQEIGNNAQGYVTYEAAFIQSNTLGWRVAPTNNSDVHTANWGTDSSHRSGIIAPTPNLTQADVLAALRARRVFATEDSNLALTLRLDGAWMGSELAATGPLSLTVDFVDPNPEPLTLHVYDGNLPLATVSLALSTGQWHTTIHVFPGHFYWVKAVQADGDTAYTAPIWIEGQAPPETLYLNEILPAPRYGDWDGNGVADHHDEFIELYNPLNRPIGLGGWRLSDASNIFYNIPLGVIIPAGGFVTFFQAQTQFSLNNNGDTVMLTDPNGTTIDSYTYPHSPGYDETWCRLPDGSSHWSDNCGPSPHASNWEKPPPGPFTLKIFDAKRLTLGAWVKVRGRVTAPPGVLGTRTMYIQDETAGIMIYLPQDHNRYFNLGDKVEVVGDLRLYHEEFEIAVDDRSDVKFLEAGSPLPPLPIATTSLLEPYEGLLVMLQGEAVHFKGWTTMWLDDGTGWAKVYIRSSTGIKKPFIDTGAPVTAVGIVSQYSEKDNPSRDDYRLLPRYQTDLILPEPLPLPGSWPSFLPETGYGGH